MTDLLLPSTDAGVLAQIVIVTIVGVMVLFVARKQPEMRLLVIGIWLVTYAGIGVRALH